MRVERQQVAWRVDPKTAGLLKRFAAFLGVRQIHMLDNCISATAIVHTFGAANHNAQWEAIRTRYGDDAPVSVYVDDERRVHILIDGEERPEACLQAVEAPETGEVHVYLDVQDAPSEVAPVQVGKDVILTRPLAPAARLPWPLTPGTRVIARAGELTKTDASEPAVAS